MYSIVIILCTCSLSQEAAWSFLFVSLLPLFSPSCSSHPPSQSSFSFSVLFLSAPHSLSPMLHGKGDAKVVWQANHPSPSQMQKLRGTKDRWKESSRWLVGWCRTDVWMKGWEDDVWEYRRIWKQEEGGGKRRHNASVKMIIREAPLTIFSPTPLLFTPLLPSCPFFTHLPSPLLLLTTSLVCLLIRAGGTIVPLLPVFGNPALKQSLFTQAVAQPGPFPSLQLGQVWLSLFRKCYNKPLSQPLRGSHYDSSIPLCHFTLPPSLSPTLLPLSSTVITLFGYSPSVCARPSLYFLPLSASDLHIVHHQWPGESHLPGVWEREINTQRKKKQGKDGV